MIISKKYKKSTILFDFDGTLVDSQFLYDLSASEVLRRINPKYTLEYCIEAFNGRGWKEVFREFEVKEGIKMDFAFSKALEVAKIITMEAIKPNEGVIHAMERLKEDGFTLAICSNSSNEAIKCHLSRAGLCEFFAEEHIFAMESVTFAKPHPEIYLNAVEFFGRPHEEFLVVEDSLAGVTSAGRAGLETMCYIGGSHIPYNKNLIASFSGIKENKIVAFEKDFLNIFKHL